MSALPTGMGNPIMDSNPDGLIDSSINVSNQQVSAWMTEDMGVAHPSFLYPFPAANDDSGGRGPTTTKEHYLPDPQHMVNKTTGKPLLDSSEPYSYPFTKNSGKPLSDSEYYDYLFYEFSKTMNSVERQNETFASWAQTDYTMGRSSTFFLGTPYPIIEPHPHIVECFLAVRWYEYASIVTFYLLYYSLYKVRPKFLYGTFHPHMIKMQAVIPSWVVVWTFAWRGLNRLTGSAPNDYECHKFGVVESKERLEQKVENWTRFVSYREEWMRRFDYHVFGIRPGERWAWLSSCWYRPRQVRYGTISDYPPRKNPYRLGVTKIRDLPLLEAQSTMYYPKDPDSLISRERPETKYLWSYENPNN